MDSTKLKVFADDVVHIMVSVLLKIKNMVGERENAGFSSIYSFLVNVLNALLRPLALSLIHYFETVQNSKKLQTTTEIWLLKDFKIQIQ